MVSKDNEYWLHTHHEMNETELRILIRKLALDLAILQEDSLKGRLSQEGATEPTKAERPQSQPSSPDYTSYKEPEDFESAIGKLARRNHEPSQ
jgi:hypothetical protein